MATLKTLKNRIGVIHSTKKITKAMKLISSAKYLNNKNTLNNAMPYYKKIESIAEKLLLEADEETLAKCAYISKDNLKDSKTNIFIIITSDKGLCGGYNINIIKALNKKIKELEVKQEKFRILCIGNKGFELAKKYYQDTSIEKISLTLNDIDIENFSNKLIKLFEDSESINCYLIYNEYKARATNFVVVDPLLPFNVPINDAKREIINKEYEPAINMQLLPILKRRLFMNIKIALLESIVSEHLARMLAMDSATHNAQEMVDKLTLLYNRTRQTNITNELIEIISGAEALNAN